MLTLKSETGNYFLKILMLLKTVGNLFDNFSDETVDRHVEIKFSEAVLLKMREHLSLRTLFVN